MSARTPFKTWLLVAFVLACSALLPWKSAVRRPIEPGGAADRTLYEATIQRLQAGESYYSALGQELRRRHFPTGSPFNWRTPLLFSALAVNLFVGRITFIVLGLLVLVGTVRLLSDKAVPVTIVGALAQSGAIWVIFDPLVWVYHETWVGLLVALSLFAYASSRPTPAVLVGLVALFVRELAAPYAILCLVLAVVARRRREVVLWLCGLSAYGVHYAWHVSQVFAHQQPGDLSHASWVQFGGLPFAASTLRTNSLVHDAPVWVTSGAVIVIALGLLSSDLPGRMRATVGVYMACFAIAGQTFNWYWGWIPGFVVPLVFAAGGSLIWNTWQQSRVGSPPPMQRLSF